MATPIDPIHVPCHLCHADPGQGCRWLISDDTDRDYFHERRISRAAQLAALREASPETWAEQNRDTEHSIAGGALCTKVYDGICYICGLPVDKLRAEPFTRFDKK